MREANLISDIEDKEFEQLGAGEREAILLVQELNAEALLIDDLAGRKLALRHNLPVVGTVGVLKRAADKGLIDLRIALGKLKSKGFFLSAELETAFLRGERDR